MKRLILLSLLLSVGSVSAQNNSSLNSLISAVPDLPPGANSASFATPRIDWVQRVKITNERAKSVASSIELVFDGDSITDYWQSRGKEVWTKYYGKLNAFDFGISADRTQHLLWRLTQGQFEGLHPKLIAIMIGTNNTASNTPEEIADGVKAIVAEYQKHCPDAVILLQAIFPRGEKPTDPLRAKIKEVNGIISKLHDGKKVIFIDFGEKFLNPDGTMSPEIMPDFLHPSAKGYEIWAEAIQPIIAKYFPAK